MRPKTGLCARCKARLTKENSPPSVLNRGTGCCKSCASLDQKIWRDKNKEKCIERQRALRAEHAKDPEWVKSRHLYQLEYDRKRNADPVRKEYSKALKAKLYKDLSPEDREKQKIRLDKYYQTPDGKHSKLRRELKSESVPKTDPLWSINFYLELIQDDECHYCSGPLIGGHVLDRADNDLGHVCYNVVPCCWCCNELKGIRLSYEEMTLLAPTLREIRLRRESRKQEI